MLFVEIWDKMKQSDSVALIPHISIDGDAFGSSVALAFALSRMGKSVKIYVEENIPEIFSFLQGLEFISHDFDEEIFVDIAVAIDSGDLSRLGKRASIFRDAKSTVNIDHHRTNDSFAEINLIDEKASSTGEIIYKILTCNCVEIDRSIAQCLYVAITTDTGGFRFNNTTPKTHSITAELIKSGIDVTEISRRVFDTTSFQKVRLIGYVSQSLELFEDNKVSFMFVPFEVISEIGAKDEDFDGIVNIGANISGVEVAVLMRENRNGETRVNLRSKKQVDVAKVACEFGGGGHHCAAGFTSNEEVGIIKEKLMNTLGKALKLL